MSVAVLPTLAELLSIANFAEIARRAGVPRGRVWRWRYGALPDDSLIEPLAHALYREPEFLRRVIDADRQRKTTEQIEVAHGD